MPGLEPGIQAAPSAIVHDEEPSNQLNRELGISNSRKCPYTAARHGAIDRYRVRCLSSRFAFQPLTLFETRFFEL